MCQSCDNAKDLTAVWTCPCGGLIRLTGEEFTTGGFGNSVGAACPDCKKRFYLHHDACDTELGPESYFVRACHAGVVVSASSTLRCDPSPPEPEPVEHTTPSGVVYVAEKPVPLKEP